MRERIQSGGGARDPEPPPPWKSQVAGGFLKNAGTDPLVQLLLDGGSHGPL